MTAICGLSFLLIKDGLSRRISEKSEILYEGDQLTGVQPVDIEFTGFPGCFYSVAPMYSPFFYRKVWIAALESRWPGGAIHGC